uniref:Uncharacterized protein LOC105135080 isoform X1 n=1 Tax=Rhizophora mucronata TaxID=61149 RepID=A0A2P2MK22_RHIMU
MCTTINCQTLDIQGFVYLSSHQLSRRRPRKITQLDFALLSSWKTLDQTKSVLNQAAFHCIGHENF